MNKFTHGCSVNCTINETKGRKRQITASITKRGLVVKNTQEDQKIRQFLKLKGFIS